MHVKKIILKYPDFHPIRGVPISKHHLIAKSRRGRAVDSNILILYRDKHDAWHEVFGNLTLNEIIAIIQNQDFEGSWETRVVYLSKLFYKTEQEWVLEVLMRIRRFKSRFSKLPIKHPKNKKGFSRHKGRKSPNTR